MSEEQQQPIFSLNNKVVVVNGFYKKFKGRIQNFKETKTGIEYEVKLDLKDNRTKNIYFKEEQLKKAIF